MWAFTIPAQMASADPLDDWIAFLLPTHSLRQIHRIVHVGRDRIRAVRDSYAAGLRLMHRLGPPRKATLEIKQAVINLTIQHPSLSDFHIAEHIHEHYSIHISRATINRLRHLAGFRFLPPKHCQN
jgi:transposase